MSRSVQKHHASVGQRKSTEGQIYDFKVSDSGMVHYLLKRPKKLDIITNLPVTPGSNSRNQKNVQMS